MRDLKLIPDTPATISLKGQATILTILTAARDIFIDNGYGAFSLRQVSQKCGLARGNITYYFASRDELLAALLRAIISGYMWDFDHIISEDKADEEKLADIITLIINDLSTHETSMFFPELWALSSHNETAAQEMKRLYDDARKHIIRLIKAINPHLSQDDREALGLFISAAMEGQTPFIGHSRAFAKRLPQIRAIAIYNFIDLIQNIRPQDIQTKST